MTDHGCISAGMTFRRAPLGGDPTKSVPPLNWRRGFLRLWILASIAWLLGWSIYLGISAFRHGWNDSSDLFAVALILIGPPLALLAFGFAAAWAFRGFAPDRTPLE
ncbi:hypothetical protein [Pseudolabrys taiwanensis]|nr:hypothetical protein [Pseudolabrys taiwanensis]